jgi:hypothetical protein
VPGLLADVQEENCVETSQELLTNENFLKNIVTGDETWVYGYGVETKMQSSQSMGKWFCDQKSTDESVKAQADIGCVFYWNGIFHHKFVPRGQMVNKQLYQEILARLRDAVRRKTSHGFCSTTMPRLIRRSSSAVIWQKIRHPLCSIHPILRN